MNQPTFYWFGLTLEAINLNMLVNSVFNVVMLGANDMIGVNSGQSKIRLDLAPDFI